MSTTNTKGRRPPGRVPQALDYLAGRDARAYLNTGEPHIARFDSRPPQKGMTTGNDHTQSCRSICSVHTPVNR